MTGCVKQTFAYNTDGTHQGAMKIIIVTMATYKNVAFLQ